MTRDLKAEAVAAMDRAFGLGVEAAHDVLRENAGARRIYDCALVALASQSGSPLRDIETAIEAGARAFHDAARDKGSLRWETASEKWRQDMRDLVRPVVTAAIASGGHELDAACYYGLRGGAGDPDASL